MRLVVLAAVVAFGSVASVAVAEDADQGAALYNSYCVACHGSAAHGAGEIAGLLTVEPPDLTTLSQRNDGVFPMLNVIHIIDGRTGVRAHGGQMPTFGSMLATADEGGYGSVIEARGRILSLALYLESIQQ